MRRADVRQSNAPPWGQCLNRIGGRPVLLAWPDDWLHEHAGQLAPNAPLTERICPGVKDNNLLEILGFRSVVQPDGHAKLASFCPAPHEDQVSDFEEKSFGRYGRRLKTDIAPSFIGAQFVGQRPSKAAHLWECIDRPVVWDSCLACDYAMGEPPGSTCGNRTMRPSSSSQSAKLGAASASRSVSVVTMDATAGTASWHSCSR